MKKTLFKVILFLLIIQLSSILPAEVVSLYDASGSISLTVEFNTQEQSPDFKKHLITEASKSNWKTQKNGKEFIAIYCYVLQNDIKVFGVKDKGFHMDSDLKIETRSARTDVNKAKTLLQTVMKMYIDLLWTCE